MRKSPFLTAEADWNHKPKSGMPGDWPFGRDHRAYPRTHFKSEPRDLETRIARLAPYITS